jgi:glycosyltransferase involved in cell wall biosynthesis
LSSLREAIAFARIHGVVIETIVVLDRPDDVTKSALQRIDFSFSDYFHIIEIDRRSVGLARNDAVEKAKGRYVRLTDGGDLLSFNLLSNMYFLAEQLGPRAILIAEWVFGFGDRHHCSHYEDLKVITPLSLIDTHPFGSQIFFSRSLFGQLRFDDLARSSEYAYDDWHFATEAVARGYEYHVAKDTILFYRRRQGSTFNLVNNSVRQIPPSSLFLPSVFRKICAAGYQLSVDGQFKNLGKDDTAFLDGEVCSHLVHAANLIEPAISPDVIRSSSFNHPTKDVNLAIGNRYYEICNELKRGAYSDIFILPYFGKGGAEKYIANIILNLLDIEKESFVLIILGQQHPDNAWSHQLPPRVSRVDLGQWLDEIGARGVDIITLRLIQSVGPSARLHVRDSDFGQRFLATYGRALGLNKRIFYCFSQAMRADGAMRFIEPWRFRFVSENIENIDLVVTDNRVVAEFDRQRIGIASEKWRVLPPLCTITLERETALAKPQRSSNRILWASRLAKEKRPELIIATAKKLIEQGIDLILEVHGEGTATFDTAALKLYGCVEYRGAYNRFSDCAKADYVCFMYTSSQDGLPNVLLEAAVAGLPIVAPDVGGISEFVEGGVTGLLLPDLADADSMADVYVDAIARLRDDPGLRLRIATAAYDQVASRYDSRAFRANLINALEISVG